MAVTAVDNPCSQELISTAQDLERIREAVFGVDSWLESMRIRGGYSGPVVHWWDDSLFYQGPGLDWRYEGIIIGYLNLWAATGDYRWLKKAKRAGDDLVAGQLPSGNFRNSRFELNPGTGGTPHEGACDLGLLKLARTLRTIGDEGWWSYKQAALWNIQDFYLKFLWSSSDGVFYDDKYHSSFVPNKAATLVEALFALADLCRDDRWVQEYALPTLEMILRFQIKKGRFAGAIYQNSFKGKFVQKFFPFYIARCIPALLEGYSWTGESRFAEAAYQAGEFLLSWRYKDGSFPQVIYSDGRINRYPQWVAALGDLLRVLDMLFPLGMKYDRHPTLDFLLVGQQPDGGIRTATGFSRVLPSGNHDEARDNLAVCGWVDKAFHYLTGLIKPS